MANSKLFKNIFNDYIKFLFKKLINFTNFKKSSKIKEKKIKRFTFKKLFKK